MSTLADELLTEAPQPRRRVSHTFTPEQLQRIKANAAECAGQLKEVLEDRSDDDFEDMAPSVDSDDDAVIDAFYGGPEYTAYEKEYNRAFNAEVIEVLAKKLGVRLRF